MDNLLCDESWLSSPITPEPLPNSRRNTHVVDHTAMMMAPAMDETTVEEAIVMDLKKESCLSNHGDKFLDFIVSKNLTDSRFDAVQWLIQTRSRLNLSYETVFSAANVFDRFVYMTSCNEWTNWMVELVAVTSLSIASKFNEVTTPMLQELQMEGLNHMFHHKTLVEMEVIMLKALDWRVNSVTSYSFLQILMSKMGLEGDCMMMSRITNHLLDGLCDVKMLRYPPSVIAFSAMWNVLVETGTRGENLVKIMDLLEGHKENIVKCLEEMKLGKMDHHYWPRRNTFEVKSFVSMLQGGGNMINDVYCGGDLTAMFQIMRTEGSDKKRDREEFQDQMRPAKRMTMVMSI